MSSTLELSRSRARSGRAPRRERASVPRAPIGRRVYRLDEVEAVGLLVVILVVLVILALTLGVTPLT